MTPRLVVFAKAPRAGAAKTRLIPALGPQGAARLAERLLRHTLGEALAAGLGPVELCRTPTADPCWQPWRTVPGLDLTAQGPGDLGARLARAARRALAAGHAPVLLGTDCPALDRHRLRAIAEALAGHDAVLVPAGDGGYVALGLRRFAPEVFSGIAWSTATVAADTRRRLAGLGWSVAEHPPEHDIDEPADLARLGPGFLDGLHDPGDPALGAGPDPSVAPSMAWSIAGTRRG